MLSGFLQLTLDGEVQHWHGAWRRWIAKDASINRGRRRYHFKIDKKVYSVYANRLVWIIQHREPIPKGYIIDHKDENKLNDVPSNLTLMELKNSHEQGNRIQEDKKYQRICRWFEFVGWYGREPLLPCEHTFVEEGF